jgi:DNA-directed RNA polymerase sigma subunit (sigma70/sigma32)
LDDDLRDEMDGLLDVLDDREKKVISQRLTARHCASKAASLDRFFELEILAEA